MPWHTMHWPKAIAPAFPEIMDVKFTADMESKLDQIEDAWSGLLMDTRIGINTALAKAQMDGKPIFEFDPDSRGAKHYEALTREVARKM